MKNIPAKNIQRITLIMAMFLGFNLTTTTVFAQDSVASEKIQLISEALYARDAGDLLLAKEKVEKLIALAPDDENVQNLLLSINQLIEEEGVIAPDDISESEAEAEEVSTLKETKRPSFARFNSTLSNKFRNITSENTIQIEDVSPEYVAQKETVEALFSAANAQILAGDLAGATSTLLEIEARNPNSKEAKLLSLKLSQALENVQGLNIDKTRATMMNAVDNSWDRPKVFQIENSVTAEEVSAPSLQRKLESIKLPKINFTGMELTRVIESLSELSLEYDSEGEGVNMVALFNPSESNPKVNITLRNLSLDKILQFVTQQVNFTYEVGADAVTIQASDAIGGSASTVTEFFPLSRATVVRLTGFRDTQGGSIQDDPFADTSASSIPSVDQEKDALQKFFQNAGVNFEGVVGSSLAFDGEQLIVTQTPRNIERLRTILRNYTEVKQVEIETKFLEVSQNDLDELGFHWNNLSSAPDKGGNWEVSSNLRSLNDFGGGSNSSRARISKGETNITNGVGEVTGTEPIELFTNDKVYINPPKVAESLSYGTAANFFKEGGITSADLNFDLQINALARKSGSDLMSAPKVTVLSGKRANIVVAQELRFPQSYGDIESTVSSGGGGGDQGAAAVSITAGTPEDFTFRNVGVEMAVTPNVESDNRISLILEPRVTEFEGFVEFGGPSIALSGQTTAIVPSGFFQPIFSTREITTEVTIFDGATVVMGGLTRDEVKSVNDKVPFLGDIPGLGRLFRSEGETRQKRNLLIFVTANLVSPGGSLTNQSYDNIKSNTTYQSPAMTIPAGNNFRNVSISE
ncbi:MAG: type II secretion system protein GspD [Coraliomargaritaceae bacterium]